MRFLTTAAVLLAAICSMAADKSVVRPISTQNLRIKAAIPRGTDATTPSIITSAEALSKVGPLTPDAADAVRTQVDFNSDQLVVFWWTGKGHDRLDTTRETIVEKKTVTGTRAVIEKRISITFVFTPGSTRDPSTHLRLFIVPKGAEIKVETVE
jgi:hypothetical protein